jgi:hypothetical protein
MCCYEPITKLTRRAGRVKRDFRIQRRRDREAREQGQINSRGYNPLASNPRSGIFDN